MHAHCQGFSLHYLSKSYTLSLCLSVYHQELTHSCCVYCQKFHHSHFTIARLIILSITSWMDVMSHQTLLLQSSTQSFSFLVYCSYSLMFSRSHALCVPHSASYLLSKSYTYANSQTMYVSHKDIVATTQLSLEASINMTNKKRIARRIKSKSCWKTITSTHDTTMEQLQERWNSFEGNLKAKGNVEGN